MLKASLLLLLLTITQSVFGQDNWQLWKDKDGVSIYTQIEQDGYVQIRAVTTVKSNLSGLISLLRDVDNVPNWMDSVAQTKELKRLSITDNLVYTLIRAPWPVKNRDMVTFSYFFQPSPCELILDISHRSDISPEVKNVVRIQHVKATWHLTTLKEGMIQIDYRAHANTGGTLPKWIANRATRSSTFKTFINLRNQIIKPSYQEQVIEGIKNCPTNEL